jgi:enoyl-[acyl-carrier protein] reductase II
MAGQSVGMVTREQPTAEIIAELVDQAVGALMARGDPPALSAAAE